MLTDEHVAGKRVLEVGSYDVNGSIRPYIESLGPAEKSKRHNAEITDRHDVAGLPVRAARD